MQLSDPFLQLAQQQLHSLGGTGVLQHLVLYIAQGDQGASTSLVMVEQWPEAFAPLPPAEADPSLRTPVSERRWYPLQHDTLLLGALRAETHSDADWSDDLDQRLQVTARAMATCLSLDLERSRLQEQLDQQQRQINLMVHQLRNPLAALRTYAQLLLRRLGPDSNHRELVENLLQEQGQLNRYIAALDRIGHAEAQLGSREASPLLLPPVLPDQPQLSFAKLLQPLVERANATAALQGRTWHGPTTWPTWMQEPRPAGDGVIAEILANLMENAFRYSPSGSPLGLHLLNDGLCLWDGGTAIPDEERERIFKRGVRGSSSRERSGSGLGLALARQLAEERGGSLDLAASPAAVSPDLPAEGNAFVLRLPPKPVEAAAPQATQE